MSLSDPDEEYTITEGAKRVLQASTVLAIQLNQTYVTSEHILYSLLNIRSRKDIAIRVLKKLGVDMSKFKRIVYTNITDISTGDEPNVLSRYRKADQVYYSPKVKEIIALAGAEAISMGTNQIGTEHLLLGIILSDTGIATSVFKQTDIDVNILRQNILELLEIDDSGKTNIKKNAPDRKDAIIKPKRTKPKPKNTEFENVFEKYTTDLTYLAKSKQLLPVIGRVEEIERVIQTLLRKSKNNPVVLGEPGVGKTAIVEGLAQRIIAGDIPIELSNKRIMTVDMPLMVAGTKYRGQFEERLTQVINEVVARDDIVLFFDELHMMVGAGDADGAMDASNILKPALSRGDITIIGATTLSEYRKFIEKDGALERRFQQIQIEEPCVTDTIQILYGIKEAFERYHNVNISGECLEKLVSLCDRYITDRNFPDKAIDVLDETCAYLRLKQFRQYSDSTSSKETEAREKNVESNHSGDFETAVEWRNIERIERASAIKRRKKYDRIRKKTHNMGLDHVERVIARITGIPINSVKHGDKGKIKKLGRHLEKYVIGQSHAIETIVTSIKRAHTGLSDQSKPIGCFLFLGPTGVGKTHLTKTLAQYLFDSDDNIIRVDMSEMMESHSVSKLIGAPPGYVGHDSGGKLTEQVRRKPYSVILFDEIEKAHPDILNILLQVLDDGILTDAHGVKVNFKNTIIILTSNIGAREIQKNTVGV